MTVVWFNLYIGDKFMITLLYLLNQFNKMVSYIINKYKLRKATLLTSVSITPFKFTDLGNILPAYNFQL